MAGVEVLGAVASAIQLVDLCTRATISLSGFLSRVVDAPELISRRQVQLKELADILLLIRDSSALQTGPITSLLRGVLQSVQVLQDEISKIEPQATDGKTKRCWKSLVSGLREKKILEIFRTLDERKTGLTLCIVAVNSSTLQKIDSQIVRAQTSVVDLSTLMDNVPLLGGQIADLQSGIPNIAGEITSINRCLPAIATKLDLVHGEIPKIRKLLEQPEPQRRSDSLLRSALRSTAMSNSQGVLGTPSEYNVEAGENKVKVPLESGLYNFPSSRIADFVGRNDLIKALDDTLPRSETTIQIASMIGMGGSGKTQLALKYGILCSEAGEPVFWADAANEERLKQSFETLAEIISRSINLPIQSRGLDSKIHFFQRTLSNSPQRWFLILDNYDVPSKFENLKHFLPNAGKGRILITSRHPDSARLGQKIEVNGMQSAEALELLLRRAEVSANDDNLKHGRLVIHRLGYLPLAIDQAGSYMRRQRVSFSTFITHYHQRSEKVLQHTPQLWEYKKRLSNVEGDSSLSVFTTWELSFHQLEDVKEIDFISLIGYFNHVCISEELFQSYHEQVRSSQCFKHVGAIISEPVCPFVHLDNWLGCFVDEEHNWNHFAFRETLANLRDLFLVEDFSEDNSEPCKISLHPLVSDWIKLRTKPDKVYRDYMKQASEIVASFLKSDRFLRASQQTKHETLAHVDECLINDERFPKCCDRLGRQSLRQIGSDFAHFYKSQGRYKSAADLFDRILHDCETSQAKDDSLTLRAMHNLAEVCHYQGRYVEAKSLYCRAISGQEEKFGRDYPNTLSSVENFANLLRSEGQYDEAERLYERVLSSRKIQLGEEHPDTLRTLANLANIYQSKGRYSDAEELYIQVLAARETLLGHDHCDTLWTINDLANNIHSQGRYLEAEKLYKRVLAKREMLLGHDHPDTLWTVDDLANNCRCRDLYADAEALYKRALAANRIQLGHDHPETLWTLDGLAKVYFSQGRLEEAEAFYNEALAGRKKRLGVDHHNTIRTVGGLGNVYHSQGRYVEAEILYKRVLTSREKQLGYDHPKTLATIEDLAENYLSQNCEAEAVVHFEKALSYRELRLGRNHPDTIRVADKLAKLRKHHSEERREERAGDKASV